VADGGPYEPHQEPAQGHVARSQNRPGEQPGGGGRIESVLFGPREFADGRVRVYGCSPGCLVVSLVVSVLLSVLLTLLFNLLL
jgi:hypothetical protein